MLHLIVTDRAADFGRVRSATFSIAAHTSLILAAVSFRQVPVGHAKPGRGVPTPLERVHYLVAAPPTEHTEARTSTVKGKHGVPRVRKVSSIAPMPKLALTIPVADLDSVAGVDTLNLTGTVSDSLDFASKTLADAINVALVGKRAKAMPSANGAYSADVVDRVVTPLNGNPRPVYPRSLEASGVQADFTVMFVVDSTGRVDEKTVEVPGNVHRLFAESVRYALMRSRYLPAMLAGRPVRQLVSQEFVFRMVR